MFAGAAREAVFSNPEVIRRVNADFIPVALKAALVNHPPDGDEGRLYREIGRSKPAPQGICVANSGGKVLDWALMFDDDSSVLEFLDLAANRFRDFPDAKRPVAAERFMKFPSMKLPDTADSGDVPASPNRHVAGTRCPAQARFRPGTIVARLFGRALGADGEPVADTIRQEHYVEDRFDLSVESQELLAQKLADAGTTRFKLPDVLGRAIVAHAFLGQLDVNPLGSPADGGGEIKSEFWASRVTDASVPADNSPTRQRGSAAESPSLARRATVERPVLLRIEGKSHVAGGQYASRPDGRSDGRLWEHEVRLTWEGTVEMNGNRVTRLLLAARGSEKLKWGNAQITGTNDVSRLPGGHPIDLACDVRYGIIGEPVSGDEVAAADAAVPSRPTRGSDKPRELADEDPARQLLGSLGPQFAIFLDVVQDDLKVSDEQKRALNEMKSGAAHGLGQFMQEVATLPEPDREKKHNEFRAEANKQVGAALAQLLKPDQQKRLRQIMLQQDGLFALGNPEVAKELKFTGEQEQRFFMRIIEETQKRMRAFQQKAHEAVQQKARETGNPEEVQKEAARLQREAATIRKVQEEKIAAMLSEQQREQWKAMLGKPLMLDP